MFPCCYRFRKWKNFNQEPNKEKGHHRGISPNIIETVELLWQLRLLTRFSLPCVLETQSHYTDRIITFPPLDVTLLVPGAMKLDKHHFDIHIFAVIII